MALFCGFCTLYKNEGGPESSTTNNPQYISRLFRHHLIAMPSDASRILCARNINTICAPPPLNLGDILEAKAASGPESLQLATFKRRGKQREVS